MEENNPDLESMPENIRLMYLLTQEMKSNIATDAAEQVSKKYNFSEEEKQTALNEANKLFGNKTNESHKLSTNKTSWYCELCDKTYKKASKNRHLNSKLHKNKL